MTSAFLGIFQLDCHLVLHLVFGQAQLCAQIGFWIFHIGKDFVPNPKPGLPLRRRSCSCHICNRLTPPCGQKHHRGWGRSFSYSQRSAHTAGFAFVKDFLAIFCISSRLCQRPASQKSQPQQRLQQSARPATGNHPFHRSLSFLFCCFI